MDAAGVLGGGDIAQLQDALAALGATTPRRVCRKKLLKSDVNMNQSRLLLPRADKLTEFLTASERDNTVRVRRNGFHDRGMHQVPTYDSHGRRYDMELMYANSIERYRLCGYGWNSFLRANHLEDAMAEVKAMGRKLEVEVWAFRSKELRPHGGEEADGQHPDGDLGFVVLVKDIGA